jgi:hypothetical protein
MVEHKNVGSECALLAGVVLYDEVGELLWRLVCHLTAPTRQPA